MKSKKLLSLLLALMMMLSVVPFYASAADPIALTEDNIAVWPTFEGEMFYGQKLNEGNLQVVGGVVTLDGTADGTVVAGHFEFTDPEYRPTQITGNYASITFIPDDKDSYAGFTVSENENAVYAISKTDPVLQDPVNDPPVAAQIAAGKRVMQATLSGGTLMNPYTKEVIAEGKWAWTSSSRTKVVNESGYFQAVSSVGVGELKNYYNNINMYVYVRVEGDTSEAKMLTTIVEEPTITTTKFTVGDAWSSVALTGGKVVDLNGIEVDGEFTITNMGTIQTAGNTTAQIMFIPSDDYYSTAACSLKIVVDTCPISFGPDHKGTSIDDPYVLEVDPGTVMDAVRDELKINHLNAPKDAAISLENQNGRAEHGRTYKVTVKYTDTNYTGSEAYVTLMFKDVEFAVSGTGYNAHSQEIVVNLNYSTPGTFDVYVDGKLIGDNVAASVQVVTVPYKLETSGTHTVKVVYNPIENGYYFMEDYEGEIQANLRRKITLNNVDASQKISVNGEEFYPESASAIIRYGDEISIKKTFEEYFISWVITDAAGKEVTLDGVDLTSSEITFTMPDHDLVITAKTTLDEEENPGDGDTTGGILDGIFGDIDLGGLTEGDSDNAIINIFNNIIAWIKNIIVTITNLFRSIGDNT